MSELIQVSQLIPGVSAVALNRPDRRNALSIELLEGLIAAVESLARDEANRVIILHGNGPVFSAGLDLREAIDDKLVARSAHGVEQALRLLRETPLISIAAVHGGAFAGGAGVMAACDIVIAADDASIGFPEARRGLLPALISDVLRHRVREGDLRDLFLTGEAVTAQRAQQIGLVQRVVPADQLKVETLRVAEQILTGGPETIRATKRLLNDMFAGGAAGSPDLGELHLSARQSDEAREGLRAFIEKREPHWRTEAAT
jgi:methylglutaconyl-CoA hydratase